MRSLAALVLVASTAVAEAKPTKQELDALIDQTDAIAKVVSSLRGLPVKKRIPRGVMSQDEIQKRLIARLDQDYGPGELAAEEKALKRLRLLPAEMDYRKEILALLTEQIAGFYDPSVKELYIADWIETGMQRMGMAPGIGHPLQGQRLNPDQV